jgi:hypothetical protein
VEIDGKTEVQDNAYSMHRDTKNAQTSSPWLVLTAMGLGRVEFSA